MARLAGELVVVANSPHLYQVIAGFVMLQRAGLVDVALRFDGDYRAELPTSHLVELRLAGGPTIAYDMIDGYNFVGPARLQDYLARVDLYFKRSFNEACHAGIANAGRIVPFGLNYPVTVRHPFFARIEPPNMREWPRRVARLIAGPRTLDVRRFEDVPRPNGDPTILFQTRTWDPDERGALSDHERGERAHLNEMRAACVRRLRQQFGARFRGGFMPGPHARATYPDCVLEVPGAVSKRRYMRTLKDADICVATAGLHGSNGWSLGEYVAASKAVVSQHLRYAVPGFTDGRHYAGFATADECVERVSDLVDDPAQLRQMQIENYAYYHRFLRPDQLILNSLLLALSLGSDRGQTGVRPGSDQGQTRVRPVV